MSPPSPVETGPLLVEDTAEEAIVEETFEEEFDGTVLSSSPISQSSGMVPAC